MAFDKPQSRNEAILQNMLGANNELEPPKSRVEALLQELSGKMPEANPSEGTTTGTLERLKIGDDIYTVEGGGSGTSDYDALNNKPQIAGVTLSGDKSLADLGIASATTVSGILDGTDIDSFGDVEAALGDKVDKVVGKGLSTNDYTDAEKSSLAGKQDALTAGNNIKIDNDTISVNRWAVPAGKVVYTVITSDENYGQNVHVQRHTLGGAFIDDRTFTCVMYNTVDVDGLISIQNPYASFNITLLKDSDEQQAGYRYTVNPLTTPTSNSFTFTMEQEENANDLIIRSELDTAINAIKDGQSIDSFADVETALAGKADLTDLAPAFSTSTAYTVGQYVSYDGNIYKCTSAHSAGAWVAGDFTLVAVGSELESKQNATDNSLQTTDKTVVGAINEHEGDISSLKSGLTNLDNEVNGDATTYPYADVITISDAVPANVADCKVKIEPVQDLHGYANPWVGGANVNLLPSLVPGTYEKDGIIVTVDNNGNMNISGTKTASSAVTINVPLTSPIDISANYYLHIRNDVSDSNVVTMGITFSGTNRIAVMNDMQGVQNCVVYIASVATLNINARLSIEKTNNVTDWSPYENICPITGHTEASVQRDGKNLAEMLYDGTTPSIIDGTLVSYNSARSQYIRVEPNTTYSASFGMNVLNAVIEYTEEKTFVTSRNATSNITFTTSATTFYVMLRCDGGGAISSDNVPNCQLELGQTATDYEPYQGKTYTIALGDTIYGGTVDFNTGVMTVTKAIKDLGTLSWDTAATNTSGKSRFKAIISGMGSNGICSQYKKVTNTQTYTRNDGFSIDDNGVLYIYDSNYEESDATAFTTAMDGVQLCYELVTPTTIQLTPQQIQLLQGQNTITASTGQISVTSNGVSGSIGQVQEQVNGLVDCIGWGRNVNLLQIKFNALKSLNTNGTWNDNVYSYNGVNYTFDVDDYGNVYRITANGTATPSNSYVYLFELDNTMKYSGDIYSCLTTAGSNTTFRSAIDEMVSPYTRLTIDEGNGDIVRETDKSVRCWITVYTGYKATNVQFEPMIRDSSVTNTTYEPYHPVIGTAVEELLEKVPDAPTTDGAYVLTVTVADGTPTYSWESAT